MRILVIGAGALGGYVGACLARAGEDVALLEQSESLARLLNAQGLLISRAGEPEDRFPVTVLTTVEGQEPFDLVFVAVKTYQTGDAVEAALPATSPSTRFLTMQNGVDNATIIADRVGPERVLCGITYHSIQHVGPGRLSYRKGVKPIQIAPYSGEVTPDLETIGAIFRHAGLETDVVPNIDHVVWQKLLHNAVVNPVSALTGLTCREMLHDEDLLAFMRDLTNEIVGVMRARGVPIVNEEDPFRPVMGSLTALGKNRPSMWQDLVRGRQTEVDAINGAVVNAAERLNLTAPHNRALVHFIHSRERQTFLKRQELARRAAEAAAKAPVTAPAAARATPRAADAGMAPPGPPLESTRRLKELIHQYYLDVDAASKSPDRLVACCSSLAPVELVWAMGGVPYLPENHAALIAATREGGRYLARASAEGYSQFANSAMRLDVGAMLAGDSPLVRTHGISGPPRPDLVVFSTNTGRSLANWFQFYGERYRVPVVGLNPPAELDELERIDESAAVLQMLRLVDRLEEITRTPLDPERLSEAVQASADASNLWREILDLARAVPTPITFFDMLVQVAPMLLLRGTKDAVDYYRLLKAELEDRVANGVGAVPGERLRVYWDGPPIWCALRPMARRFTEVGAAVVASTFGESFVHHGLDPNDPIASLATSYSGVFANRSERFQTAFLAAQLDEYGCDMALLHDCRTAPQTSHVRYGLVGRLERETGVPAYLFEADSHDLRLFSMERLSALLEDALERRGDLAGAAPQEGGPSDARI